MSGLKGWMGEERAQATVEMAIVAPVLIVLALVAYNAMMFASAVARFDRVAPDVVLAHAVSPVGDGGADVVTTTVEEQLAQAMAGCGVEIEVVLEGEDDQGLGSLLTLVGVTRTYRCVMRYAPWPSALTIAGVDMGAPLYLEHERAVVIDPWRPGVVM